MPPAWAFSSPSGRTWIRSGPWSRTRRWDLIRRYRASRQAEAAPRRALRHVFPGEAGDALVLVREPLELGAGDVAIEIVEGRIAHQLLHVADEVVRRMLAVGAHDPGRRARAHGLVGGERGQGVGLPRPGNRRACARRGWPG